MKQKLLGAITDAGLTILVLAISVISAGVLVFLHTAEVIQSQTFYVIYGILGLATVAFLGLSALFNVFDKARQSKLESATASAFFVSETTKYRVLSNPLSKFAVWFVLVVLVVVSVGSLGSLVGTPNPYGSAPLSSSALSSQSAGMNVLTVGVFPGLFEEAPIFFLCSAIILLIVLSLNRVQKGLGSNPFVFTSAIVIAVTFGAGLFTFAHAQAYGLNGPAFVSAFVFEWLVQFANQITGFFGSWIVHIIHNSIVVYKTQTSFAIGGFFGLVPGLSLRFLRESFKSLSYDLRRWFA